MKGKDCVVIASDHRYGIQFQTISTNFPKIHRLNSKVLIDIIFFSFLFLLIIILWCFSLLSFVSISHLSFFDCCNSALLVLQGLLLTLRQFTRGLSLDCKCTR